MPSHPRTERLEDLSTEAPAGPTVMRQAHQNGERKACAVLKNRLAEPQRAEDTLHQVLVSYLRAWHDMYRQGVRETVNPMDRTLLDIRRDTVIQILAEVGRQDRPWGALPGSEDGSGSERDRPADGLPPADR